MKYLITGGCGFLGSNVASEVLKKGEELFIYDNMSRVGGDKNLQWLKTQGNFEFLQADTSFYNTLSCAVRNFKPDVIYHFAGQVAMTTSIQNPRKDFETNALGSFNLLEAVREAKINPVIIYSSTNKVYGDLENFSYTENETRYLCPQKPNGFDERITLDFHSPYGCSKGAADQYMLDYARIFGLRTIVFRHSSMYGARQFGTFDQGWISWFCQQALETKKNPKHTFTISGDGKQVRDVLHARDMVRLYLNAPKHIESACGKAFNIGGGMQNSLSLLELFSLLEKELSVKLNFTKLPPRESDQKIFVADIARAKEVFGWQPEVGKEAGVGQMLKWLEKEEQPL